MPVNGDVLRLLVIEDEQADAELILHALDRFGLVLGETAVVSTETEYLRRLEDFGPDVIISDYTLPRFSGEDALRLARERCPEVPFIVVSGMLGEDRAVELLKAGAWDYVLKDRLTRLGPAVGRALDEAREAAARRQLQAEREAADEGLRRSQERLEAALDQLQGLQEMTAALAGAMNEQDVAAVLEKVTHPLLGAARGLLAVVDQAGHLQRVHAWSTSDGGCTALPDPWPGSRVDDPALPFAASLRSAGPVFLEDAGAAALAFPRWSLPPDGEACVVVPLGSVRPIGVLALGWRSSRPFPDEERALLRTAAAQCTQAIERVRLFESQATVAQALQRALLPEDLPEIPGLCSTARYLTAHGDAVGGDWYDLLTLPDGGVAVVMGDVEGHSASAAAVMGQARNVLRAYAAELHGPAEIMRRLNRFVSGHLETLITCCYAELDPVARVMTTVTAGHPLPVVMDAVGRASQLQADIGLPLGVDADAHYREHTSVLPERGWLVLYTDGLVDGERAVYRRRKTFLERLSACAGATPSDLADAVVLRRADAPPLPDDAAFLVVRLCEVVSGVTPERVASRTFRATPAATPSSRHFLLDVLVAWQLHDLRDVAGLATSELVTNAVLHTAGDVRLTVRRLGEHQIWIGVTDDSDRLPHLHQAAAEDISGRGLAIIDLVADEWGVDLDTAGGKTVWLRLSRPAPDRPELQGARS